MIGTDCTGSYKSNYHTIIADGPYFTIDWVECSGNLGHDMLKSQSQGYLLHKRWNLYVPNYTFFLWWNDWAKLNHNLLHGILSKLYPTVWTLNINSYLRKPRRIIRDSISEIRNSKFEIQYLKFEIQYLKQPIKRKLLD